MNNFGEVLNLNNACENLIRFKDRLDGQYERLHQEGRIRVGAPFASINPCDFMRTVMPFCVTEDHVNIETTTVPPFFVVGGSFRDYGNQPSSADQCNQLNESARKGLGIPRYYKLGDIPLFIASEGKNRVQLFRKHEIDIVASVVTLRYPKASELKIHTGWGRSEVFFVSCSGVSVQIAFPDLILPILRAYGVEDGSKLLRFANRNIDSDARHRFGSKLMAL